MEKHFGNRILLGTIQHLTAVIAFLTVAVLVASIYIDTGSQEGAEGVTNPLEEVERFEDTGLYKNIFRRNFNDILRLVVIREQMETNGMFDGDKLIDVTAYANRKSKEPTDSITARYCLEDLLRWGRYGIEYVTASMTKEELVNYFGSEIFKPSYFYLDDLGNLQFIGFPAYREVDGMVGSMAAGAEYYTLEFDNLSETISPYTEFFYNKIEAEEFYNIYYSYSESGELVNLVYDYIVDHSGIVFTPVLGDDGKVLLSFSMLKCRYSTADGVDELVSQVGNWVDYSILEGNLVSAINNLTLNYDEYQSLTKIYSEDNTNFKYLVRYEEDGVTKNYTNMPELAGMRAADLREVFESFGSYEICMPGEMTFQGNVQLDETEVYHNLQSYEYTYPENVQIWVGVDTDYPVQTDVFALGNRSFNLIVPHFTQIMVFLGVLVLIWLGIWLYLTVTAGRGMDDSGKPVSCLNGFDRIWTEVALGAAAVLAFAGSVGYNLLKIAITSDFFLGEKSSDNFYSSGDLLLWGTYGLMASLTFSIMWYSLIRRIRGRNLWKNSFLHLLFHTLARGFAKVSSHPGSAVRTFVPYCTFLGANGLGALLIYMLRHNDFLAVLILSGILAMDITVGILLFRRNAEQIEIVRGINRIREGDVDYQLQSERLHGDNRSLAEAVNNIGDGIRKAVETSMKDERMKADLITNVSHDIKTPLTSIINYVDLLKRERIEQEPVKTYIEVLVGKSQRLKQLTDDLVEASKISSGNIIMEKEKLNLTELLNQTVGEFSERLEQNGLELVFASCDKPAWIYADSRRMWRIVENLFNNICKYAMPGTRVYIDLTVNQGAIEASVKNISRLQLNNIRPEELTERFVRGDASRTTEGSGLGLSIAKSLTRAQGGEFFIYLDGDLFKVTLSFPEYREPEEPAVLAETDEQPQRKRETSGKLWKRIGGSLAARAGGRKSRRAGKRATLIEEPDEYDMQEGTGADGSWENMAGDDISEEMSESGLPEEQMPDESHS